MANYYQTLGVEPSTDPNGLRDAYRKLARKYHPDVNPDPKSHDMMARINEAFRILIDPVRRSEYDAMLRAGLAEVSTAGNAPRQKNPISVRLLARLKAHKTPIYALCYAPDGALVSGSFDNELLWWNMKDGQVERTVKLDSGLISTLQPLENGKVVTAGTAENMVSVCSVGPKGPEGWKNTLVNWASCVGISPDGKRLASGTLYNELCVSDVATGHKIYEVKDHEGSVTAVAWSEDGKFIATGSSDETVRLRDAETGETLHTFMALRHTVSALAFSPDNRSIAVASVDLSVRSFSLADGGLKKVMFGHTMPIEALAFHPNGWLFATGSRDGKIGLWNSSDGVGQVMLEASSRPVLSVAFSKNGSHMAAGGLDKLVRIWSVKVKAQNG